MSMVMYTSRSYCYLLTRAFDGSPYNVLFCVRSRVPVGDRLGLGVLTLARWWRVVNLDLYDQHSFRIGNIDSQSA